MAKKKLFTEIPYIEGERLVLKRITQDDAPALQEMVDDDEVYLLEPTFLFERKYDDVHYVIDRLYDECFRGSIIMGIYFKDSAGQPDSCSGGQADEPSAAHASGHDHPKTQTGTCSGGRQASRFCGIAELYGYKDKIHKVSVGIRLMRRCWGQGIGAEALSMLVDYLYGETDVEIIAASSLPGNYGSAGILRKCGFTLVVHNGIEDWGYGEPVPTDKWIK